MPLIVAARLTKVYPPEREPSAPALAGVSLRIEANEVLGIVGPNGAGKTTLVDVLATVLVPASGTLRIAGVDALSDAPRARGHVGYVPSGSRSLYGRLTARQNLRFFGALNGLCGRAAEARVDEALARWGASAVADLRADRMSDGMACRVALARAVLHDPAVLLLDEATRSIDPMSRHAVLQAIRGYADRAGKCVVLVTHDLSDVHTICNRVAVMSEGIISRVVPPAALRDPAFIPAVAVDP